MINKDELSKKYKSIISKYTTKKIGKITDKVHRMLEVRGLTFQYNEDEQNADLLFIGINPAFKKGTENTSVSYNRYTY